MKTSLIETKQIEEYLLGIIDEQDAALFEARLILDKTLEEKTYWQGSIYKMVRLYSRKKIKSELEALHQKLFKEPQYSGFRHKINSLFKK